MNLIPKQIYSRLGAVELRIYDLMLSTGEVTVTQVISCLKLSEFHIRGAIDLLVHKMLIDRTGDVIRVKPAM